MLRADGGLQIRRWWNTLDHLQEVPSSPAEQAERYRALFMDACRMRMRSDVPIGTALSGGLDSSAIVCAMHHIRRAEGAGERLANDWQRAFVATYPGAEIDERQYADAVIEATKAKPVYCEITPGMYLQNFERVLFQFEEISDIHLGPWIVHRRQRESGIVVTIDGHGGDEALGGYPWHLTAALKDAMLHFSPLRAAGLLVALRNLGLFPAGQFYLRSAERTARQWKRRLLGDTEAGWLVQKPAAFAPPAYQADASRLRGRDGLFLRLYSDFHYTELPTNLRDFDRLSMAHGVEVRSPFMDWRLVTYAFSLPSAAKVGRGYTKRILRDALTGILPEQIRLRTRKLGFPNLEEGWTSAAAHQFIRDSVASAAFQNSPIWDGGRIQAALHLADRAGAPAPFRRIRKYVAAMHLMNAFGEKRLGSP